jgi:hypothetical protein
MNPEIPFLRELEYPYKAMGVDSMLVRRKPLNEGGVPCEVSTQSIPEHTNRLSDLFPIDVSYERVPHCLP